MRYLQVLLKIRIAAVAEPAKLLFSRLGKEGRQGRKAIKWLQVCVCVCVFHPSIALYLPSCQTSRQANTPPLNSEKQQTCRMCKQQM